jgi:hypothetical protein
MAVTLRELATPALPSFVPTHVSGVFDAFGWAKSDVLTWGAARFDRTTRVDRRDPKNLLFVMRRSCTFLPRELARLHVFDMGFGDDDWALSPCAIDEATDELYARRALPKDLLWLAADNLGALFWGLHDWAHFHNHGSFEERAWTEYHCDRAALEWLRLNRDVIGLSESDVAQVERDVRANIEARFVEEGGLSAPRWPSATTP